MSDINNNTPSSPTNETQGENIPANTNNCCSKAESFQSKARASKSAPNPVDKRTLVKSGPMGVHRESMHQSELQILPQLGKSKSRGHALPPPNFTYGLANEKNDGGVQEALSKWANLGKDAKEREERFKLVKDFMAINKAAIRSGCITAKENSQFRATNDIKKRVRINGNDGSDMASSGGFKKVNFPPGMTFGMPHRPSTPIHDIMQHRYLWDWLKEMQTSEDKKVAAKKEASMAIAGAYHTKSSWLKNAKIPVEEKPLWKMARFRNAEAAVDSFRTEAQRQKSFSASCLNSIPREGVNAFKQGVYKVSTTKVA